MNESSIYNDEIDCENKDINNNSMENDVKPDLKKRERGMNRLKYSPSKRIKISDSNDLGKYFNNKINKSIISF